MPVIHQKRAQRGCQGKTGSGSLARELQSKSFVTGHVEADDNINSTKPHVSSCNMLITWRKHTSFASFELDGYPEPNFARLRRLRSQDTSYPSISVLLFQYRWSLAHNTIVYRQKLFQHQSSATYPTRLTAGLQRCE
ncbi:hypothetical protein IF2G_02145 [Cordyceps javanica]|nr:hypothetical protein IF2G_02145 [Cordyceps javanica]